MKKRNKQQGSVLLLVTLAVMFLAILGTAILSMTAMNVQMQYGDRQVKKAHYDAEAGIEEAYALVGQELQGIISRTQQDTKAYMEDLQEQAKNNREKIKEDYRLPNGQIDEKRLEVEDKELYDYYTTYFTPALGLKNEAIQQVIDERFRQSYITYWGESLANDGLKKKLENKENYHFTKESSIKVNTIQGMKIERKNNETWIKEPAQIQITSTYTSEDKIKHTIDATIEVGGPNKHHPLSIQEKHQMYNPIWNYSLVAGKGIETRGAIDLEIQGNVYSGGADEALIVGAEGKLSIKGDVVMDGDIRTFRDTRLTISEGNIFCNNLIIQDDDLASEHYQTNSTITIKNSYLYTKDDIELNGQASHIHIEGTYIGFSDGSTALGHDTSSSININAVDLGKGNGSSFTLKTGENLKQGQGGYTATYLSEANDFKFADIHVIVPGVGWLQGENQQYQTGESVAVIGNYVGYMPFEEENTKYTFETVNGIELFKGGVTEKIDYFYHTYESRIKERYADYPTFNVAGIEMFLTQGKSYVLGNYIHNNQVFKGITTLGGGVYKDVCTHIAKDYTYIKHYLIYRTQKEGTTCNVEGCKNPIEHYINLPIQQAHFFEEESTVLMYSGDPGTNHQLTIKNGEVPLNGRIVALNEKTGMIVVDGDLVVEGQLKFKGSLIATGKIIFIGDSSSTKSVLENKLEIQADVAHVMNEVKDFRWRALFKNGTSYQRTMEVIPGVGGQSAYKYKDFMKITQWRQR